MKNHYIQAVVEMIEEGTDISSVLSGLSNTLKKKGHMRLHGSVLRGVVRILGSKNNTGGTKVTVVSVEALESQKEAIQSALTKLNAEGETTTIIDPTIIGGIIVGHDNVVIDASYKSKLTKLYRTLTK